MLTQKKKMTEEAKALKSHLSQWRRRIHARPELGFQEYQTAEIVKEELQSIKNMQVETGIGKTGVIGTLTSGSGPTIIVRADMDALPITEQNNHDFCSSHEGIMHACGHDMHTAILLGVSHLLADCFEHDEVSGTVKLLFQPSEETTDEQNLSGAARMIEDGVLEGVDGAIALHACPWHPAGEIQINDGYSMANVDVFEGEIYGTGGHGAYPHQGTDPIWMLGHVLQTFYGIISRRIPPLENIAASIGEIHTGTQDNIIPQEVIVKGTLRSYSPEMRRKLESEIEKAFHVVEPLGGQYRFSVKHGEPALNNHPELNKLLTQTATNLYPDIKIHREPFGMGGEDFGYVTEKSPGAMFFLGCGLPDGISRDLHTPIFNIDERCMPQGAAILAETAIKFLNQ